MTEAERSLLLELELCGTCHRPHRKRCYGGILEYDDGSSMACENWNIRLDEIGGMTHRGSRSSVAVSRSVPVRPAIP